MRAGRGAGLGRRPPAAPVGGHPARPRARARSGHRRAHLVRGRQPVQRSGLVDHRKASTTRTASAGEWTCCTDPDTGALSGRRRFISVPAGIPDGLTHAEGGLAGRRGTGELRRYTPDGTLNTVVRLPVSQVTSVASRADLSTLYITTARENFTPADRQARPGRRHLRLHPRRNRSAAIVVRCLTCHTPGPLRPAGRRRSGRHPAGGALIQAAADPYRRDLPLHVTASALTLHPPTARVLLRWHQRQQAWLQVGRYGDPGETDPLAIVAREAEEETGLSDLAPWPDAEIKHVVIVNVPPGKGEPAHQHADVRFLMATQVPDAARPESAHAPLRWLSLTERARPRPRTTSGKP